MTPPIETIMEVRERWPGLPILAISGGGVVPAGVALDLASRVGANAMLAKPYSNHRLIEAIASILGFQEPGGRNLHGLS